MSTRTATTTRSRRRSRPTPAVVRVHRARVRRRRISALLFLGLLTALVAALVLPRFHNAVQEIGLPLRHEDIIRQQAADKRLDPALIAAVIFSESHFIDGRTSSAGAEGLMQLTPATAHYIAQKSGGTQFETTDLATPQVNIAYGAFYLRYLMDHYGENRTLAVAAYNAGEGNVDRWVAQARAEGRSLTVSRIPFGETRAYVTKVLDARREYRRTYARELGA